MRRAMSQEASRLIAAQKAVDDTKKAATAARDAADAALAEYHSALTELSDAHKEYDLSSYPSAIVRYSDRGFTTEEFVVVVKRNKRITTRVPGQEERTHRQWKQLQDGTWVPYERWRNRKEILVLGHQ